MAVIKRWPANTGPNTCYGDFGVNRLGCIIECVQRKLSSYKVDIKGDLHVHAAAYVHVHAYHRQEDGTISYKYVRVLYINQAHAPSPGAGGHAHSWCNMTQDDVIVLTCYKQSVTMGQLAASCHGDSV